MTAYYNEHDPYAAEWLRRLILNGHLAPGDVDESDIRDVRPDDLKGYTQCHFFAGIGVWSHALRRAGWPDDRPIWTGSCPCQPFSAAGARAGFADERHLWPAFNHLIDQCQPATVVGEQVENAGDWLDLVSADLEAQGYAFGAAFLPAAGFSGAHIRSRSYWMAHLPNGDGRPGERGTETGIGPDGKRRRGFASGGIDGGLADSNNTGLERRGGMPERADQRTVGPGSVVSGLADADRGQRNGITGSEERERDGAQTRWIEGDREFAAGSATGGVADADGGHASAERQQPGGQHGQQQADHGLVQTGRPGAPMLGRHAVDWLFCRDGKWRPTKPGLFPLVDAYPNRVGVLRAAGNALDAETATRFLEAVMASL